MLSTCPPAEELLRFALGDRRMSLLELEDHLLSCATCREDIAAVRRAATELRAQDSGNVPESSECFDDVAVIDVVLRTIHADRRTAMLGHLGSCASCRREVAAVSRLLLEPAIRNELTSLGRTTSQRSRRLPLVKRAGIVAVLATAATAVVLLTPRAGPVEDSPVPEHRAPVLTLSAPPSAIVPVGPAPRPLQFAWTSVSRAVRYDLTLFDQSGSILWETQTTDTVAVFPESISLVTGAPYFWRARARIGFERWSESDLVEFTLVTRADTTPQ